MTNAGRLLKYNSWVYEEFVEFLVIKPKANRQKSNRAQRVLSFAFLTPATLVAG